MPKLWKTLIQDTHSKRTPTVQNTHNTGEEESSRAGLNVDVTSFTVLT